ncbi:hypothetical protein DV737_g3493, partial [Chaetothyriales sp. CBS 132003]
MKSAAKFKMWYALVVVATLLNLTTPVNAFFRHLCHGQVGMSFAPTIDQLMTSNCTSCSIIQDKSAYWSPQMYFQHSNGTFELVPTSGGLTVYYFTERPDVGDQIHPFPQNFRMMTGNTFKRTNIGPIPDPDMSVWGPSDETQASLMEKSIGFNCLNYSPGSQPEGSLEHHHLRSKTFLDAQCLDGVRAEIQFPSCWNGKDLDSPDHMAHIQYPSRLREGPCPANFSTRLPTLFFETIYQTDLFSGISGQFVFSNGDPTGYGYHADFIAGWEDGVLQAVINNDACTGLDVSGNQWDCPVFNLKNVDDPETLSCRMQTPDAIKNEAINFVQELPGNNPIQGGPQSATEPRVGTVTAPSPSEAASLSGTAEYPASTDTVITRAGGALSSGYSPTLTAPPSASTNIVTRTSVSTLGGTIYRWVVIEEIVTVTVTVNGASPTEQEKRHAHGHYHHRQ